MALALLTSSDAGAPAREKINAAIAEAAKVVGKQDAFDLAALRQAVSLLATTASVAMLRADLTLFQTDTAQQFAFVARAIAAKVDQADYDRLQNRVTSTFLSLNQALAGKVSTSAIADLIAAVSAAASRADLDAIRNRAPGSREKPGDGVNAYTLVTQISQLAGEASALLPLSAGDLGVNAAGSVVRVSGAGILAGREAVPVELGRIRELRAVVSRFVNSPDPNNDSVRIGVVWLDRFKQVISIGVAFDLSDLLVASGRLTRTAYVSASAGAGINLVAPPRAVYFRSFVQMFGAGALTDAEILVTTDVTGLTVPPAASTDLVADVTALKSQNAGDRLAALESAVNAPNSVTFATRSDAAGGVIPATVTTISTRGGASPGDGDHALYRRVSSLGPGEDGFVNSRDNSAWFRITASLRHNAAIWGVSPNRTAAQNLAAMQACMDWCRDNGARYEIPSLRFPMARGLKVYTGGTCLGTFLAENASTAGPEALITVQPLPADIKPIPASFFNGLTMVKGMSEDAAWGPYYAHNVYWRTSSQKMLAHPNGVNYALADSIVIGQPDGKFSPAYSWTKDREWTAMTGAGATIGAPAGTGAWAEKLRERIECEFKIEYTSGTSGEAECAVAVHRSNTTVKACVVNSTGFPIRQAVRLYAVTGALVKELHAEGLQQTTTNYSVQCVTTTGAEIRAGSSLYGRRSVDVNENGRDTTINGGRWTDGIGGHLGYRVYVKGHAWISADGPNSAPLFFSGGDLYVDETCTVRLPAELGTCCAPRADAFENSGSIILRCTFEIDCFKRGGSTARIYQYIGNLTSNPNHDFGRRTYGPDYIEISGTIKQFGADFTGPIELINMFDGVNTFANEIEAGGKILLKPTLKYDAGLFLSDGVTPRTRAFITKSERQWTKGDGYDVLVEDVKAIDVRFFCTAGRTGTPEAPDNGQRSSLTTRRVGRLRHLMAPGAFRKLDLSADVLTNAVGSSLSRELSGRKDLAGDEIETRNDTQTYRFTWAPGVVPVGGAVNALFTIKGLQPNDICFARHGAAQGTGYLTTAGYATTDTVRVAIENKTNVDQTIPSGTLVVYVLKT